MTDKLLWLIAFVLVVVGAKLFDYQQIPSIVGVLVTLLGVGALLFLVVRQLRSNM